MKRKFTQPEIHEVMTKFTGILKEADLFKECKEILWNPILQVPESDVTKKLSGKYKVKYEELLKSLK